MPLNLIMLGPPGAGKGTQAERFARTRGIPKISTGDILREAVAANTDIGRRAKVVMDRGELVGDEVMIGIVKERLERPDALAGFVLDGFPRTVVQATALDTIMNGRGPLIVLDIVVPELELVRRLSTRMICAECGANAGAFADAETSVEKMVMPAGAVAGAASPEVAAVVRSQTDPLHCRRCGGRLVQRSDDNDAVVLERLKVYHRQTEPLVEYYRTRPTFRSIDGAQGPERVAADLAAAIEAAGNGDRRGGALR
jgi:adenylate kinase